MSNPNVIFILTDDLGWKDLSCYGSDFYETPSLDRLASESVRFTDAYAASPVCSPTRASILTGRYPARVGVTNYIGGHTRGKVIDAPYIDHLPQREFNLAKALKLHNYNTWHVGKWHLGSEQFYPEKQGFDRNIGGCFLGHPRGGYFSPWNIPTLEDHRDGEYLTDRLTDEAIRLIENNDDRPFFLNLWYYTVHTPIQAKPEKIEKYRAKAKILGIDQIEPFEFGDFFPCEHKKNHRITRRKLQSDPVYAAMIESLDENVGRLIDLLDAIGQSENTMIFFTSDNGGLATSEGSPTCNAPLSEGKGWTYEGGLREPLIVRWKDRIEGGRICDVPISSPDFYPTILHLADLPQIPDQHCDGESFAPLLDGSADRLERNAIFWHYPHYGNQGGTPASSIRCGDHKLIEFFEDDRIELYNLRNDIGEEHDLADQEKELAADLRDRLAHWRESIQAKIPERNPDYVSVS